MGFYGSVMYEDTVAREGINALLNSESNEFSDLSQNIFNALFGGEIIIGDITEDTGEETE